MLTALLAVGEIGRATRAQIVAALPGVLRVQERPDPAGEARYRRVVELARRAYPPEIAKGEAVGADTATRHRAVEAGRPLLDGLGIVLSGPLREPAEGGERFPEYASLRGLAKLVALSTREAASRGEGTECLRDATLGLKLSDALIRAKGDALFLIVATGVEAIASRAAFDADVAGGLSDAERAAVLALMPPLAGPMPEMATSIRREFYQTRLPVLLDPVHGWKEAYGAEWSTPEAKRNRTFGNYDPIATARLIGREYEAAIQDSQRAFGTQTNEAAEIAAGAERALPQPRGASKAQIERLAAQTPNSLGLALAAIVPPESYAEVGAQRATRRNLARAAILLRHGEGAVIPDPFGKGPLRVDPKRRIVWSVGENGKDDGAQIGRGFGAKALDMGYRY